MAHPVYLREKARELRAAKRLTIDELADRLALSRSTIYYWVRDMPIPGSGSGGGWPASAHRAAAQSNRHRARSRREAAYRQGIETFEQMAHDPTFRDFVALYLAEGTKRNRNRVAICNSDDAVVAMSARWLRRLSRKPLIYRIQYHADQKLAELCAFWGARLSVEPDAIVLQRKSNSRQLKGRMWRSRHGVLTVAVNDTLLRARLQGWMHELRQSWG
jgi:excisionase family DNA binding protein